MATINARRHKYNQIRTRRREDAKKSRTKLLAPWSLGVLAVKDPFRLAVSESQLGKKESYNQIL